jgi:DNA repair exonuclease SbcCD ATPase subunit
MQYRVIKRQVPDGNGGLVDKFYAIAVPIGRSTLRMIAKSIAQKTLANEVDVEAILLAVVEEIPERLLQGQTIELPPLGNFRLTVLNNGGSLTLDAWDPSLIKGGHLVYDAPKALRDMAKNAPMTRWVNREAESALNAVQAAQDRLEELENDMQQTEMFLKKFEAAAAAAPDNKAKQHLAVEMRAHMDTVQDELDKARAIAEAKQQAARQLKESLQILHDIDFEDHDDVDPSDVHIPNTDAPTDTTDKDDKDTPTTE